VNKLNKESILRWHRRFGHYYIEDMNKYLDMHNIKDPLCIDCRIAKMKRKSHNKKTPKAKQILEVIHSDIIGPISDSFTGKRFIITFIDEFSHKSWIYLMDNKKKAIKTILSFLKYINNLFDYKKIKVFKSDNAKEYKNNEIIKYCEENGIQKIYSPPYNPENNGIAERFNQTLISCTKTLLYWSKLSENFWDYAIMYADYLYNKTPHQIARNNIPDETFYGYKVKLNHIRTFGCIKYYKDYSQNKNKVTKNSLKGIFLGFSELTNSYIVMDYKNYKIHNVSDIECLEDEPANLSLSNSVKNNNDYTPFFKFDFNFSKIEQLNKYFFTNFNNNPDNLNIQHNNNNVKNNNDSHININKKGKDPDREDTDENNDTNNNNNNNFSNSENDNESYFSAEENIPENNFENNEKIFDNKNLNNSEENLELSHNNNLGSNFSSNNFQNDNNLSSEKLNFSNSVEQNINNLNLKNLNSDNNISENNNNNQTLMDIVSDNDMNIDNDNNIFSNYNQYMDNISSNNTNNISNKSTLNNNSNFNLNNYNNNINEHNEDYTTVEEVIDNSNVNNNSTITPLNRKTLIINNDQSKIPEEYSAIRKSLQRSRYAPLRKNPFKKSNIALVKTRTYNKKPFNINFKYNITNNKYKFKNIDNNYNYKNSKIPQFKVKCAIRKFKNKFIANIVTDIPFTYYDAINSKEHL